MRTKIGFRTISQAEYLDLLNSSIRWKKLLKLCGELGDSSQETVTIYQDDATSTCTITVGKKRYSNGSSSVESVLDSIPSPDSDFRDLLDF